MPKPPALKMRMPKETEKGKQARWIAWLRWLRYVVLQIGQFRWAIRCEKCGRVAEKDIVVCRYCRQEFQLHLGYGNDPGAPDMIVTHPDWTLLTPTHLVRIWVAAELKADEKSTIRPAQQELIDAGHIELVYTDQMLLEVINTVNEALKLPLMQPR